MVSAKKKTLKTSPLIKHVFKKYSKLIELKSLESLFFMNFFIFQIKKIVENKQVDIKNQQLQAGKESKQKQGKVMQKL